MSCCVGNDSDHPPCRANETIKTVGKNVYDCKSSLNSLTKAYPVIADQEVSTCKDRPDYCISVVN